MTSCCDQSWAGDSYNTVVASNFFWRIDSNLESNQLSRKTRVHIIRIAIRIQRSPERIRVLFLRFESILKWHHIDHLAKRQKTPPKIYLGTSVHVKNYHLNFYSTSIMFQWDAFTSYDASAIKSMHTFLLVITSSLYCRNHLKWCGIRTLGNEH